MKFHLVYGNHWNFGLQVADTLLLIQRGLMELGHDAVIERDIVPGGVNILQECFKDDFTDHCLETLAQGTQFILVATEYLTGATFNQFDNKVVDDSYYFDADYWHCRYRNFCRLVPHALAIWHLCEEAVPVYRQHFPESLVDYLPHAYVPGLTRVEPRADADKDIDFLFTGAPTAYRRQVLTRLMEKGYRVVHSSPLTAPFHREDLLSRAKISLNIKQFAAWPHPSPSRFFYHLINRSLILSENSEFICDLQAYVPTCPIDQQFMPWLEAELNKGDYQARADKYFYDFRQASSLSQGMASLLERTFL